MAEEGDRGPLDDAELRLLVGVRRTVRRPRSQTRNFGRCADAKYAAVVAGAFRGSAVPCIASRGGPRERERAETSRARPRHDDRRAHAPVAVPRVVRDRECGDPAVGLTRDRDARGIDSPAQAGRWNG